MTLADILGHEHPRAVLGRILASGRVPHAILFHGPEGVGKRTVADRFALSLLCSAPGDDGGACGRCAACTKAAHGNHPDFLVTTRLPKKEGAGASAEEGDDEEPLSAKSGDLKAWIVVSQIRELSEHASFAPREAERRVFVIDPADRMNAEAQNALLKTLEEPPGRAVLLLIASRPHALLPTVRSRCSQIGFAALAPETLARGLVARGIPEAEARARAALSEGRPGRALSLDLEHLASRRGEILDGLEALSVGPRGVAAITDLAARVAGDDEATLLEGLDLTTAILRDAARSASGNDVLLHGDVGPRIAGLGRALGAERAARLVALADRLRGELRLNLNKAVLVETLLAAVAGGPVPA